MSPRSCGVKLMCLSSLVCLSVGPVALFYICSTLIRNYISTSHYIPTTCQITDTIVTSLHVTDSNMTSPSNMTCQCKNETGGCDGQQSCVKLIVKYQLPQNHGSAGNALLYENYEERGKLSENKDVVCSYYACVYSATVTQPSYDVMSTGSNVTLTGSDVIPTAIDVINAESDLIHTGSDVIHTEIDVTNTISKQRGNFTCFVNPKDSQHVLKYVTQKQEIFTGLFWPLFGIFLGLCFCIAAKICTREKD